MKPAFTSSAKAHFGRRLAVVLVLVALGGLAAYGLGDSPSSQAQSTPAMVAAQPAGEGLTWHTNYQTALAAAQKTGKPVLIDFYATWCVPCQMMEKHVWQKPQVAAMLAQRVVPLKVDVDLAQQAALAQRFGIEHIPTIILVDSQGQELERMSYGNEDEVLALVKRHQR